MSQFSLSQGTPTASVEPDVAGEHVLLIGASEDADFDGGVVSVKQDGITFASLEAVTDPTRRIVWLRAASPVIVTLAGAGASADVPVIFERVQRNAP